MAELNKYVYSYGYFYKESEPKNGSYIQLPDFHSQDDRKSISSKNNTEWDMCIFLYNDSISNSYTTNNYGDEENARAINFIGDTMFEVNMKTFEKRVVGPVAKE
jgi:hypothetical protein